MPPFREIAKKWTTPSRRRLSHPARTTAPATPSSATASSALTAPSPAPAATSSAPVETSTAPIASSSSTAAVSSTPGANTSEQPLREPPLRLLQLPPELRTIIFQYTLSLPAPRRLVYTCLHVHRLLDSDPEACTHSDDPSEADDCGHLISPHERGARSPAFWPLVLTHKQVHRETAGMITGLNTMFFADVHDLRCFGIRQRANSANHNSTSRSSMQDVRFVEVGLDFETPGQMREIVFALTAFTALETITLHLLEHGLRKGHEAQLLRLADVLPRLRSCKLVARMDESGPCGICDKAGCSIWIHLTRLQVHGAKQMNEVVAKALASRLCAVGTRSTAV